MPSALSPIKHMTERFLSWKLPTNFNPDAGISFKNVFGQHWPLGTNLLSYTQAEAMVRYMLEGLPTPSSEAGLVERAVMVCPQCEGEGSHADGLDEAACTTDCTRCGGNGWIVDLAALRAPTTADRAEIRGILMADIKGHAIFAIDDTGANTDQIAWVEPADSEDAFVVLSRPPVDHDNRSGWQWIRLQDGTLILGVFPHGDTYMEFSDAGVCDWEWAETEKGGA